MEYDTERELRTEGLFTSGGLDSTEKRVLQSTESNKVDTSAETRRVCTCLGARS